MNADLLGLIGEYAGLHIRLTKRNKIYKRITVLKDNCTLLGWRPVYHVSHSESEAYRKISAVYMKALEFEWWCSKTHHLMEMRDTMRSVTDRLQGLKREYEVIDYLWDYTPITRKQSRLPYALVPGMGLQEITASSYRAQVFSFLEPAF